MERCIQKVLAAHALASTNSQNATMTKTYGTPQSCTSLIYNRIKAKLSRAKPTKIEAEPLDIWLTLSPWYSPPATSPSTVSTSSSSPSSAITTDTSLDEQLEVFTYPINTLPVLYDNGIKPTYDNSATDLTLNDARLYSTITISSGPAGTPQAASVCSSSPCREDEYTYRDALDDRLRFKVRARSNNSGELSDSTTLYVPEECEGCHVGMGLCEFCGMERIGELDRQALWLEEERRMSEREAREMAVWKDEGCVGGEVRFREVKWT